ncbi:MAG: acyl-CoA dehydrogenase family protein [Nocardioidaceae bacterium]
MLGARGRGFAQFLATLDDGRIAIAALAVGCIQACLELCVQYAGERTTFGKPDRCASQGVAFQIADLAVMAQAAPGADVPGGRDEGRHGPRQPRAPT